MKKGVNDIHTGINQTFIEKLMRGFRTVLVALKKRDLLSGAV